MDVSLGALYVVVQIVPEGVDEVDGVSVVSSGDVLDIKPSGVF